MVNTELVLDVGQPLLRVGELDLDPPDVGALDQRLVHLGQVLGHDGATDVSQVIAAIDWVVQNRNADGLNIRVMNLSFGTDATQSYVLDPLAYAVEQAWNAGIVVVVAAGNDGNAAPLRNPASDPFVIERCRDTLWDLIKGPVDLLFCNEQEARSLTGLEDVVDCAREPQQRTTNERDLGGLWFGELTELGASERAEQVIAAEAG